MKKIRVAVLFGGRSSEYAVSLKSASAVIEHMNCEIYECFLIGITREGDFYYYEGEVDAIFHDTWMQGKVKSVSISTNASRKGFYFVDTNEFLDVDIIFPVLHGKNGEDGTLQGVLELAGIPYVGCDMLSSALCMDKFLAHQLVSDEGIEVPKSCLFSKNDSSLILEKVQNLKKPLFVKPVRCGSSFGITKVCDYEEILDAVANAFAYDSRIVIEEMVDGFECGCAILGNDELIVGEVDEIEVSSGFFDYDEKYTLRNSQIHLPARLPESERKRIQEVARKIYRILGCRGFARVDLFYTKDHRIVFNEINTIPGFTSHSRYPAMLEKVGFSFEQILEELIRLGLER